MTPMLKYGYSTRHTMGVIQIDIPTPDLPPPLDLSQPPVIK
jgi:hypothetical protein